jgi:hypothetical protein
MPEPRRSFTAFLRWLDSVAYLQWHAEAASGAA